MQHYQFFPSPLGQLRLVSNGEALTHIEFEGMYGDTRLGSEQSDKALRDCALQLSEYFDGKRSQFELPLAPKGTDFQQQVWQSLREIPYGECRSYADIAAVINRPKAMRAVGAANGRNPLPIVVPCHRVIGSNGTLTGFAGGLEAKRLLLGLEAKR